MIINIAGNNKTSLVDWKTFKIQSVITNQVDTLTFALVVHSDSYYKPDLEDEVIVNDGGTKIFAGNIIKVDEQVEGGKLLSYGIYCQDYSHLMDKKLVFDTYENEEIADIVRDILATYCPGFSDTNVDDTGTTLEYILFNYEQPSKCIQKLAELIGYDWYVDWDKDIHFFNKQIGEAAPFDLDDTGGKYVFDSLMVKEDDSQLRNVVYVRGGEYVGDSREDKVGTGDGVQKSFNLPYRYDATPTVTVGGAAKTVGVDFIDDPLSFDCLWNYQEKVMKFNTAPVAGDIKVTGLPLIPVLIKAKRGSSVNTYGEVEHVIIDKTLKTKQLARQRAEAEFNDYALPVKNASFITKEAGLKSGQKINIQSSIRHIDNDFTIEKVITTMRTPASGFFYSVEASTGRSLGIINFLQKQIEDTNKKVGVFKQEGEVLDIIVDLEDIDSITISEEIKINDATHILDLETIDSVIISEDLLRAVIDSPPTWVFAPYFPINDGDRKRPAFFDRDCNFVA
jgi:hypothetical protein